MWPGTMNYWIDAGGRPFWTADRGVPGQFSQVHPALSLPGHALIPIP